jgi:hypothetical protein
MVAVRAALPTAMTRLAESWIFSLAAYGSVSFSRLSCALSLALPGWVLVSGIRGTVFTLSLFPWPFPCLTDLLVTSLQDP